MTRKEQIRSAYRMTGGNASFYDVMMTYSTLPGKEAAFRKTFRVLKKGGTFCGCFYVQGGCSRTDWFIRHLYQPKGFFTPPYETETRLRQRLFELYRSVNVTSVDGISCFRCVK
jgi:ubiquinone/menaquinone biosynthesis C-methylase UbiE